MFYSEVEAIPYPPDNPKDNPMSCPTVGIIVGHHPDAPGAHFHVAGETRHEFDIWDPFARELAKTFDNVGLNGKVIRRPNPRPDAALGRKIKQANVSFAFELHFNAVEDSDVSGTLTIFREGHTASERLAGRFQKLTRQVLGLPDRATFGRSDLGIMRHTPDDLPLILCEPAFGSNSSDVVTMLSELPDLMKAYRGSCVEYANSG